MPGGTVTADGGDPTALVDGTGAPDAVGASWTPPAGPASVLVTWARPRELTSVELVGDPTVPPAVRNATVTFADGATLPVGAVLADPARPTLVSFLPRVTTSLRIDLIPTGAGPVRLAELRAYEVGTTPPRTVETRPPEAAAPDAPCRTSPGRPAAGLVVGCPLPGSAVGGQVLAEVTVAEGYTQLAGAVWPAEETAPAAAATTTTPDSAGAARLDIDLGGVPAGPLTLFLEATGPGRVPVTLSVTLRRVGPAAAPAAPSVPAAGRTLVWAEEFDGPVSVSRSGADTVYSGAKPVHDGEQDFGDAIFPGPGLGGDNVRVVDDGYLQVDVDPLPPGTQDPQGWGRSHVGGMLASARAGGSGFAAQYGYFEARMLAPGGPGTWPAFWTLPADNLVDPTPVVAEVDAVELYGHDPVSACHVVHEHGGDGGGSDCGRRFRDLRSAMAWHTYGVAVGPTGIMFYIDGQAVHSAPQVDGGNAPMFFLLNHTLGGGWPVELGPLQERATLYVDHIRVYV